MVGIQPARKGDYDETLFKSFNTNSYACIRPGDGWM